MTPDPVHIHPSRCTDLPAADVAGLFFLSVALPAWAVLCFVADIFWSLT